MSVAFLKETLMLAKTNGQIAANKRHVAHDRTITHMRMGGFARLLIVQLVVEILQALLILIRRVCASV